MYRRLVCLASLVLALGWAGAVAEGQVNQLANPEFDNDFDSWGLYGSAGFDVEIVQGAHLSGLNAVLIDITDATVASIGISQGGLQFVQGETYPIGLTVKADKEREMVILIQLYKSNPDSWTDIFLEWVPLTTEPQTLLFDYTHNDETMSDHPDWIATIYLMLKGQWWNMAGNDLVSKVWIDRVHVGAQPPLVDSTILQAYEPEPRDGSVIDQIVAALKWRPGDFALSHNVYFGESSDEVSEGLVEAIPTAGELLMVGFAPPYAAGLTPGQSYYWRVDEIDESNPESPWQGNVWSFLVRPQAAWRPNPPNGAKFVDPDQDMSWEVGLGSLFHTVYVGRSADEVSDATTGGWMLVDTEHDPGPMEPDTIYYWRVDEFAGAATYTGEVWSFTTAPAGGGLTAEYFNNRDLTGDPVLTRIDPQIDFDWGSSEVAGEGSPDESVNANEFSARWTGELEVDLTDTYVFSITANNGFRLWLNGRPIIDYWGNPTTDTRESEPIPLAAGETCTLRMEYYEGTGTAIAQLFWESAVQNKLDARVRQIVPRGALGLPLKAHSPQPVSGAVDTQWSLDLQWGPGEGAAQHDVYFGDDAETVAGADTASPEYKGRQGGTSYNPGALEWGKTYYWRVDENEADGTVRKGVLWSFTTANFIVVDDFESYTDDIDAGEAIFQTWIDGWENGTGSTVGHLEAVGGTFGERGIVHGGAQSMPMDYDNSVSPFYSEAERTWDVPQDWTISGVDALVVYLRGSSGNDSADVYVAIADAAGRVGVAVNPDPEITRVIEWTEWRIPLSDLTAAGVNMAAVKTMYIGVGDRDAPTPGGTGTIYIDDIRVARP